MSRRDSDSGAAIDIDVDYVADLGRVAERSQMDPNLARISVVRRRAPRPPTWPPPLPADRVPVPPPKGARVSQPPPALPPPPLVPSFGPPVVRSVPASRPPARAPSYAPAPAASYAPVRPAPLPSHPSRAPSYAPVSATASTVPGWQATGSAWPAPSPIARSVVPFRPASPVAPALSLQEEAVFGRRSRGSRAKWIGLLVVLSLAGGVVLRDRLPAPLVDGVHAAMAHPSQWLGDRVAAIRGEPKGHPLPAPPPPPVAVTPAPPPAPVVPPTPPSPAAAAPKAGAPSSSPPEFSVSSLPVANAAAAAPARAAAYTPPPARPRPAPRPTPAAAAPVAAAQDSDDEPVKAAPPKAVAKPAPAPVAPVVTNSAPPPAPGSLDDLIRKAVAADQKKAHAQ